MQGRKIVHRETRTFDHRPTALSWIARREAELSKPGAQLGVNGSAGKRLLRDAIDRYIAESRKSIGRTKAQVLASIKEHEIAGISCADITSRDIVGFASTLANGRQPATVTNYLSHLSAVFRLARPAWGFPLDYQAIKDAIIVTDKLGVSGKGGRRERRPTLDELDKILAHYVERRIKVPQMMPMAAIVAFAIFSTRRQEEIVTIKWADLDREGKRILVRDMKHPGEKIGNDVWVDLPDRALMIACAMPRKGERIFPYSTDAVCASFTRVCKLLAIDNLHFHDLRHEGVSCLFEIGKSIPMVAAVSGHRSWQSLSRYTHIRQTGDKYENWPWLPKIVSGLHVERVPPL